MRYLDNSAEDSDYEAILSWLKEDEGNKKRLFDLESYYRSIEFDESLKEGYLEKEKERLLNRIALVDEKKRPSTKRFNLSFFQLTACVIALASTIGLGYVFFRHADKADQNRVVVHNPSHTAMEVALPDGSKIWLNHNSSIVYPESFKGKKERKVLLTGEAYFEVARNEDCPFYVKSEAFNIRVLGTSFNIKSFTADQKSAVTLVNGMIEVKGNNNEGHITLSPGQRAEIDHTDNRLKVYDANVLRDVVWHNDLIAFDNATIADIKETLESLYQVEIVLDPKLNIKNKYSGVIKKRDSIGSVLKSLTHTIPFRYETEKGKIFLLSE